MSLFSASSHEGQPLQRRVHPSPGFTTRISLCCGCFQPLPWISASLPCQLGLLLPLPQHQLVPSALPSCARLLSPPTQLGSARFTVGHHLQLLETRPALLTQEEPVPSVPALNGPLSPPWDAGPCCVPGDGEDLFSRDGFSGWGGCE